MPDTPFPAPVPLQGRPAPLFVCPIDGSDMFTNGPEGSHIYYCQGNGHQFATEAQLTVRPEIPDLILPGTPRSLPPSLPIPWPPVTPFP